MNKAELIEAINATIAPNGVKGITAESLANILIEMVNAAGGGGGGSLSVILAGEDFGIAPTEASLSHNADVYEKVKQAVLAGEALPYIYVDFSLLIGAEGEEGTPEVSVTAMNAMMISFGYDENVPENNGLALQSAEGAFVLFPDGTISLMA